MGNYYARSGGFLKGRKGSISSVGELKEGDKKNEGDPARRKGKSREVSPSVGKLQKKRGKFKEGKICKGEGGKR